MGSQIIRRGPMLAPVSMNHIIAKTVSSKEKGWAWDRGRAIDFAHPSQTLNLAIWSERKDWWKHPAPDNWYGPEINPPPTPFDIYRHLCVDYAEHRITREQLGYHFRNLVAESIERWKFYGTDQQHNLDTQSPAGLPENT